MFYRNELSYNHIIVDCCLGAWVSEMVKCSDSEISGIFYPNCGKYIVIGVKGYCNDLETSELHLLLII